VTLTVAHVPVGAGVGDVVGAAVGDFVGAAVGDTVGETDSEQLCNLMISPGTHSPGLESPSLLP